MITLTSYLIAMLVIGSHAPQPETNVRIRDGEITVLATAYVGVIPDKAEITVLFQEVSDSKERVSTIIARRCSAFVDSLARFGITKAQIDDHFLKIGEHRPEPDTRSKWASRGSPTYFANQSLQIYTTDLLSLNDIYRTAVMAGARRDLASAIRLVCTDVTEARKKAFQAAYDRASADAAIAATSSGAVLEGPIAVIDQDTDFDKSLSWKEWEMQYTHGAPYEMIIDVTITVKWKLIQE
jgi:uncharacterized protein YggE